jgi:iron complex outermembrane receptor protein
MNTGSSILSVAKLSGRLMAGTGLAMLFAIPALAQNETVVVTGSNIRGAQPVGQAVISVDRARIENSAAVTAAELLQNSVPQLSGFGSPAQASQGAFEPKIHAVGGGSSASTLTLIDGHRVPPSGGMYRISDPNIIPPGAIERIEVLPDGASAVYGSDAVAGVINVITRKDYNGWETSAQYGMADQYNTANFSQIFGHSWENGGLLASYGYSNRSNLMNRARPEFVGANKSNTGVGAMNFNGINGNNYQCQIATISAPNTSSTYAYPYNGAAINSASGTTNGICDNSGYSSLLPSEMSNRAFVTVRQAITDRINISADLLYSSRINTTVNGRGGENNVRVWSPSFTPTATVPAGQRNPFFVAPAALPAITTEQVSFALDDLLVDQLPRAHNKRSSTDAYASVHVDVDLGSNWAVSLTGTSGFGYGQERSVGSLCIPCTNLALNGTVAANGSITTNTAGDSLGTVGTVTRALNTTNALDVWNPKATNRTSAAVLRSLVDSATNDTDLRTFDDLVLKFDGPLDFLFTLPAGDIRVAFGGEYSQAGSLSQSTGNNGAGPSSTSSTFTRTSLGRQVLSAFGEILVPVINADMEVPLVRKLDFSFSGRIDKYSDVAAHDGVTTNPKVGMSWQVYEDLALRAAWGTSFTAPGIGQTLPTGGNYFDLRAGLTSAGGNAAPAFTIPSTYPGAATLCPTGCVFNSGAVGPLDGIVVRGANTAIIPQIGMDYSFGLDFRPSWLEGFQANITFWGANYSHVITNSQAGPAANIAEPGLWYLFIVNPTPAQIASYISGRVANSPIPANIQYIYDERLINLLDYQAQGIDYDINYRLPTDEYGVFSFSAAFAQKTKFAKDPSPGGPWTNALNIGNASNTFSPVALAGKFTIGWAFEDISASLATNYVAPYFRTITNPPYNTQPCPRNTTPPNDLGCQKIAPSVTFDVRVNYNLPSDWWSGTQVSLDIKNLFDQNPPFSSGTSGYDAAWGNPIGRLITFGVRKKW